MQNGNTPFMKYDYWPDRSFHVRHRRRGPNLRDGEDLVCSGGMIRLDMEPNMSLLWVRRFPVEDHLRFLRLKVE